MVVTVHIPQVHTPLVHTHQANTHQDHTHQAHTPQGLTHLASIHPVNVPQDNILQVNIPQGNTRQHNILLGIIRRRVRLHIRQDSILLRALILQVASIQAAIRHITRLLCGLMTTYYTSDQQHLVVTF